MQLPFDSVISGYLSALERTGERTSWHQDASELTRTHQNIPELTITHQSGAETEHQNRSAWACRVAVLGLSLAVLGLCWVRRGPSWACPVSVLDRLGPFLGLLGSVLLRLGPVWGNLGCVLGVLGARAILDDSFVFFFQLVVGVTLSPEMARDSWN
jgi:hypothetical protein